MAAGRADVWFDSWGRALRRVAVPAGGAGRRRRAAQVRCPILFAIARDDAVTPPDLAEKAAARAPRAEVRHYPGGHFEPYVGELFERVVADQVEFYARHLALAPRGTPVAAS